MPADSIAQSINLNALLADIVSCDTTLKQADELLGIAAHEKNLAEAALAKAQGAFDAAVLAVRGAPPVQPAPIPDSPEEAPRAPQKRQQMGPLPPTSPALHGGIPELDPNDDDREDAITPERQ